MAHRAGDRAGAGRVLETAERRFPSSTRLRLAADLGRMAIDPALVASLDAATGSALQADLDALTETRHTAQALGILSLLTGTAAVLTPVLGSLRCGNAWGFPLCGVEVDPGLMTVSSVLGAGSLALLVSAIVLHTEAGGAERALRDRIAGLWPVVVADERSVGLAVAGTF